jgi:branched-chain amino acid transport system permease protein
MIGLAAVLLFVTSGSYRFALITSISLIPLALSYVVIVGFLGQISLAQISLAGVSAFVLSKITTEASVPFPISLLVSSLAEMLIGLVVGMPALRVRGVHLAVMTLAAAVGIEQFIFANRSWTPLTGNNIPAPTLFGLNLSIRQGHDIARIGFGITTIVVVSIVVYVAARLLKGDTGRAFLAVRSNERAAQSAGINVVRIKLLGFAISGFLAGISGAFIGYSQGQLSVNAFDVIVGITVLAVTYLGGITSVPGSILGGLLGAGGVVYLFWTQTINLGTYYQLVTGGSLILTAMLNPEGVAGAVRRQVQWARQHLPSVARKAAVVAPAPDAEASPRIPSGAQ